MTAQTGEDAGRRIRHNVHSQNGEDGIVACILDDIVLAGVPLRHWAVEFGAGDGQTNSNTLVLAQTRGFRLVYLEADRVHAPALRYLASTFPAGRIRVHMETVPTGVGGLDALLHRLELDLPSDFDVLSIDVDGPDYDIWLHTCDFRPKLVIIETHSDWRPGDVVIARPGVRHGQRGGSSSLTAVAQLAERKDYVPIDYTGNLLCMSREILDRVYPAAKPPTLDALYGQLSAPVPLVVRPGGMASETRPSISRRAHHESVGADLAEQAYTPEKLDVPLGAVAHRLSERQADVFFVRIGGGEGDDDADRRVGAGRGRVRRSRGRAGILTVTFAGSSISIEYDAEGEGLVRRLFATLPARPRASARTRARVRCGREPQAIVVHCNDALVYEGRCRETAAHFLLDAVQRRLAEQSCGGALFHAATVARRGRAILMPGASRAGKSNLAAWLAGSGFDLLGDELAFIRLGGIRVEGFTTPVTIKEEGRAVLAAWLGGDTPPANPTSRFLVAPEQLNPANVRKPAELAALLFPSYEAGAEFELVTLSKADAAIRLMGSLTNGSVLPNGGFDDIVRLAKTLPAYALRYSDFAQLGASIEPLLEVEGGAR
jgi:hypothetical protein